MVRYQSITERGALLVMHDQATRRVLVHDNKFFRQYAKQHHASWLDVANNRLGLRLQLDDIVLVSGWIKTQTWSVAAFQNQRSALHLTLGTAPNPYLHASISLNREEEHICLPEYHSNLENTGSPPDQCLFLSGYKIVCRWMVIRKLKAAAESPKDQWYNRRSRNGSVVFLEDWDEDTEVEEIRGSFRVCV